MLLLYAPTSVHVWACARASALDDELARHARPLALPWDEWALGNDGEHLQEAHFPGFVAALADAVADALRGDDEEGRKQATETEEDDVLVLTDSSVDFYEGGADAVVRALEERGVHRARVDAVCGSGLLRSPTFSSRLRARGCSRRRRRRGPHDAQRGVVVLVGGWNDVWHSSASERALRAAARRFCAAARRWGVEDGGATHAVAVNALRRRPTTPDRSKC